MPAKAQHARTCHTPRVASHVQYENCKGMWKQGSAHVVWHDVARRWHVVGVGLGFLGGGSLCSCLTARPPVLSKPAGAYH